MKNYTQCPSCGTTVEEGEGFNAKSWLAAHRKNCSPAAPKVKRVRSEKPAEKPKPTSQPRSSPIAEAFAKALTKQVVKSFLKAVKK